jgi:hypothetical protein
MRKIACTLLFLAAMPLACTQTMRDEPLADASSVMLQGKRATKATEELELTWSYALDATAGLTVQYRVRNLTSSNLYVLDRLWQLAEGEHQVDKEAIYRFERGTRLRLLLGPAPLPHRRSTLLRNMPHATRVAAGATHERSITVPMPIKEYGPYFSPPNETRLRSVPIRWVHLLVGYVVETPTMTVPVAPEDATAFELAGSVDVKMIESELAGVDGMQALRRTDAFDRIKLAGEPVEPFPVEP